MSPESRPEGVPPDRVAIVGLGLMGASLAMALRAAHPGLAVGGVDNDPAVVSKALDRGIATEGGIRVELVAGAEIVVLAVPIRAMRSVLARVAPHTGAAAVTDLASTKAAVMGWATSAGVELVGGHPMAGREVGGIDA
ncbi:MAG: prephenate dehydrogenase/arogenate dehydrogenase family protein, partial [Candidatus Dormibacterales bacterium]